MLRSSLPAFLRAVSVGHWGEGPLRGQEETAVRPPPALTSLVAGDPDGLSQRCCLHRLSLRRVGLQGILWKRWSERISLGTATDGEGAHWPWWGDTRLGQQRAAWSGAAIGCKLLLGNLWDAPPPHKHMQALGDPALAFQGELFKGLGVMGRGCREGPLSH